MQDTLPFSARLPGSWIPLLLAGLAVLFAGCSSTRETAETPDRVDRIPTVRAPVDSTRAQRLFIRGLTQKQLEAYDEALVLFEQALEARPGTGPILAAAAEVHEERGNTTEAISYLEQALGADSTRRTYYRDLAGLYERTDEHRRALRTYRRLLDRFDFDEEALFDLARLQNQLGRPEEAITSYRRILDEKGESVRARYRLLQLYRQTDREVEMLETLEVLARTDSDNPEIHRMLTDVYREQGRLDQAADVLRRRLRQTDESAEVVVELAELYERMGRPERADSLLRDVLEDEDRTADELAELGRTIYVDDPGNPSGRSTAEHLFERVLARDSTHADAQYYLGRIRFQQEQYAEAGRLLYRSVERNPRRRQAWIQASLAFLRAERSEQALSAVEEALVLFPGDFNLLRIGGIAAHQAGRSEQALTYLRDATDPQRAAVVDSLVRSRVAGTLAMVYDQMGRGREADSAYAEAIALDSTNATALNNLAYSLAERETQLDRALDLARRAVDLAPETASFLDTLGWVFYKLDDLERAADYVRRAIDTGDASATVHEHYGDIQSRLGNETTAREYWQRADEIRTRSGASASQLDGSNDAP